MLTNMGVPEQTYDSIVSSGDVTRDVLEAQGSKTLLHIGPDRDQPLYHNLEATFTSVDEDAEAISCTGFRDDETETPDDYRERLEKLAARKLLMICANPDIVVERGDRLVWCAGALARLYEDLGGEVAILGKPHAPIYEAGLRRLAEHTRGQQYPQGRRSGDRRWPADGHSRRCVPGHRCSVHHGRHSCVRFRPERQPRKSI
jgi:HAD superfamily hydrolase (TIGR01459 family)